MRALTTGFLIVFCAVALSAVPPSTRQANMQKLAQKGFRVAASLPLAGPRRLRPQDEIVRRMLALHALTLWVCGPGTRWSDEQVRSYARHWDLEKYLTESERIWWTQSRQQAGEHIQEIGWRMENMVALAWVTGFDEAPGVQGQLAGPLARRLVYDFLPGPTLNAQRTFIEGVRLRGPHVVEAQEDFLYCAHNAVRSAQLGRATVPAGYDPVEEGGCVHERRHALSWCLSPGVSWDNTDLST